MAHARRERILSATRSGKTGMNFLQSRVFGKFDPVVSENPVFRTLPTLSQLDDFAFDARGYLTILALQLAQL